MRAAANLGYNPRMMSHFELSAPVPAPHILLVDDDALMRRSLAYTLAKAGYRTTAAPSGEDALTLAAADAPDLVLLDIGLPGMDGLDALKAIQLRFGMPVIFVTARRRELEQVLGLELGADDYITKPFDSDVLLARIKAVLRRSRRTSVEPPVAPAERIHAGDIVVDLLAHSVSAGQRPLELSPREFDLLLAFVREPEHVLSVDELLARVWGDGFARRAANRLRSRAPPARKARGRPHRAPAHRYSARRRLQACAPGRPWRDGAGVMRTLRARLILSHLLPILVVVPLIGLAAFVLLQIQRSISNVETGVQQQAALLQEQAQVLSNAAGKLNGLLSDPAAARAFLSSINLQVTGVTLLDAQGRVVAATDNGPPALAGSDEGQVASVLRGQGAVQVEVTGESGRRLAELAIPVLGDQRQVEGVLLLSQELSSVQSQVGNLSLLLIAIVVILFVLGILLGVVLALRLARSLNQVTGALEGIARGETFATLPAHDLLEVDALYQSVNTLAQRLRTLEDARKRLLANLVHELGRPLGSIRAAAHALAIGADDDPELRHELLDGLNAQIERMQPLLDNLTLLHGQVLGSLELNLTPTPLAPWLVQVVSLWREAAHEKGIVWKADIPFALPTAEIDGDQMSRAVGNLLSNAVKFTPSGGAISVDATVDPAIEPGALDSFLITVTDNGPGIAANEQKRIFEPFQRGQQERRFPQGAGLGLSIATDIVHAHGGTITLESTPGRGASFILAIPLNRT